MDTKKEKAPTEDSTDEGVYASSEAVPVSEAFQKATHKLTSKANKHHIMHMRNAISSREDKMRSEEKVPEKMSDSDMPTSNL